MFGFKRTNENSSNGYPTSLNIRQPFVEKVLRGGIENYDHVTLFPNHDVLHIEEINDRVHVTVKDLTSKEEKTYSAKYVIAADGARSPIRELIGIDREDMNFDHPWFVVDIKAPKELELPNMNMQYCHPSRPATYLYLGNDMYRWEIALLENETQATYKTDDSIKELLSNWMDTKEIEVDRKNYICISCIIGKES